MNTINRFTAALALAGVLTCASANAADSLAYFQIDAGPVVVRDISVTSVLGVPTSGLKIQAETGAEISAVGGFKLNEHFALELESGYQDSTFKQVAINGITTSAKGGASVVPILVGGVLSGKLSESISANFGAGIGAAVTSADVSAVGVSFAKQTKTSLMGQIKTGVEFHLSESISANLSYRLGLIDSPGFDSIKTESILAHMFTVGLGFKF